MRFGVFYEHQMPRPWEADAEERVLANALEQVELADRLGIDYVWEVEHHFLEEYSHSSAPEVFLAAASQRTKNIRLGHGIVQMSPTVNAPARIAERISTLDLISGGRVEFGTGEGSSQLELGGFGVPRGAKREMWDESLDVVVRMMTEAPFTGHRGSWVDAPPRNVIPKPKQKPHPPLWVACSRRETIELAARKGIGALSFAFVEPEEAKSWVDAYYTILSSDECVPIGKAVNPNFAVVLPFMCHADEAQAIERGIDGAHFFGYSLAHYYAFGSHRPGYTNVWQEFEEQREHRGFSREAVRSGRGTLAMKFLEQGLGSMRGAVGTPVQVTELIDRYRQVGVDQVILVAQAGDNRHEHVCESLELFAQEVMPRFEEDRDLEETTKAQRLATTIGEALARRATTADRDTHSYVVTPTGELAAAAPARSRERRRNQATRSFRDEVSRRSRKFIARLSAASTPAMREGLARRAATWKVVFPALAAQIRLTAPEELKGTMQIVIEDPPAEWVFHLDGKKTRVRPGRIGHPDATINASAADFLGLAASPMAIVEALFDERLRVEGDFGIISRFAEALNGSAFF